MFQSCLIYHRTIRAILTGGLLALFALAITPKILIHDLVAHHHDTHLPLDHGEADELNTGGFHCAIDNLVVESPFAEPCFSLHISLAPSFVELCPVRPEAPLAFSHPLFGLRGPPEVSLTL